MIVIADSGSTKTDWRWVTKDGKIYQSKTEGINPSYTSSEEIIADLSNNLIKPHDEEIEKVFFYGAGCNGITAKKIVTTGLSQYFAHAVISVEDDLIAAARATCGTKAGLSCILGTGSNSCVYNGEEIIQSIPSLGYMMADEGSGMALGKAFLKAYLEESIPSHLTEKFANRFDVTREQALENLYKKPYPNRYMAGFSKFAFDNLKDPYVYRLTHQVFEQFFSNCIDRYEEKDQLPVHFVGSIAFYYGNIIRQIAQDKGLLVGTIMESPMAGLTLYHKEKMYEHN